MNLDTDPELDEENRQLQAFVQRRKALERLVVLARSLRKLSGGIQSLLDLAQEDQAAVPAREFLNALNVRLTEQTSDELLGQMVKLDAKINDDLNTIIALSRADEDSLEVLVGAIDAVKSTDVVIFLDKYLAEFQRRARLTIALRILLGRRRVKTPTIEITIGEKELRLQLAELRARETSCRTAVRDRMEELVRDIDAILENPIYPEAILSQVRDARTHLLDNITAIDSGKELEELPLLVEEMEVADVAGRTGPSQSANTDADALQRKESMQPYVGVETSGASEKPGFWATLRAWISTPTSVTWQQARAVAAERRNR